MLTTFVGRASLLSNFLMLEQIVRVFTGWTGERPGCLMFDYFVGFELRSYFTCFIEVPQVMFRLGIAIAREVNLGLWPVLTHGMEFS